MTLPWLTDYANVTRVTNVLPPGDDQPALLTAGLIGEVGGILAELKKAAREAAAYPSFRGRLQEEVGDFLWYFVRLCEADGLDVGLLGAVGASDQRPLPVALELAAGVGQLARSGAVQAPDVLARRQLLVQIWSLLGRTAALAGIDLATAATQNMAKALARWPRKRTYHRPFDDDAPLECRLPRRLTMDFVELRSGRGPQVLLRCRQLNIGDRITDNAHGDDGYRFHDVLHMSHAVHLGWSPVLRALLRCKRKHDLRLDEVEDGARAAALEEAISAMVYRRAAALRFFDQQRQVDFDLLKSIVEIAAGLEVASLPYWQWEAAILDGYRVFRLLRAGGGGHVSLDLVARELRYTPFDRCPPEPAACTPDGATT